VDNPVVHFEINGTDGQALEKFYSEVFGWHVQSLPELGYATVDTHGGKGINGGIGTTREGEPFATFYVETSDPGVTLAKAESLGATTMLPVSDIGPAKLAVFRDPQHNVMGIVAPGEGPGVSEGDGVPVDWFEILGPDVSALKGFYTDLFGWDLKGGDEPSDWEYYEVDSGTGRGISGGIGASQDGKPHVTPYARVDDFQTYLDRAESLGGSTMVPPTEAPGITFAQFRDPQGIVFGLWQPKG
jgi:hypothetical protein